MPRSAVCVEVAAVRSPELCEAGSEGARSLRYPSPPPPPAKAPWRLRLFFPFSGRQDSSANEISPRGYDAFETKFRLGSVIGHGGYGVVRDCVHRRTGKVYACKVVRKARVGSGKELQQARQEYPLMQRVAGLSNNIVQAAYFDEDEERMYLVMEKCCGGDLYDFLTEKGPLPEPQALAIFSQICSAVRCCHANSLLHRDLKLENFLILDTWRSETGHRIDTATIPHLKLADFGAAVVLAPNGQASGCMGGSMLYQAPEVLLKKKYGFKADMWSVGVILYALLSGTLPFLADTQGTLLRKVRRGFVDMSGDVWNSVSPAAKDTVLSLLSLDPSRRPSAEELCEGAWMMPRMDVHVTPAQALGWKTY